MGIRRGAYESARRGNITPPAQISAHVPAINIGAGMSAMAGAMRDRAVAEREKWNLKPIFDSLQRVWMAYDRVKDAQYERMMNSAVAMNSYQRKVESGQIQFNPSDWMVLKTSFDTRKATYDSFGISQIKEGPESADAAAQDFMSTTTKEVRESFAKRFRIEEDARKAAEMAAVKGMED